MKTNTTFGDFTDTVPSGHGPTYSTIITPADYNRIITDEHLYIAQADRVLRDLIITQRDERGAREVVEVGCGPARLLPLLSTVEGVHLTGVDYDEAFIEYARLQMPQLDIILADVAAYRHATAVDVFVSQGFHHHVAKGVACQNYLQNLYGQLNVGGSYIVSDEFLPHYESEHERKVNAVVWYSHIIAAAQKKGYDYLAQEEAKTLLDDLFEGDCVGWEHFKSVGKIDLVLLCAREINSLAMRANCESIRGVQEKAGELLDRLYTYSEKGDKEEASVRLSRGDFKICEREFRSEVEEVGFCVEKKVRIGPNRNIGGMEVYVLKK